MVIAFVIVFPTATEVPQQYDIRNGDLIYYMLFGVVIVPFQVMMDILMNHATELAHGVKIYDYMLYAKWRWRNRLTRWLFDDPRFDQSIGEQVLWKPRDNASAKAFADSIKHGIEQKEMQTRVKEFRENFFQRHKEWILSNVGLIFTPRHSRQRYRGQLSEMYQKLLSLESPFEYRMPDEDLLAGRTQKGLLGNKNGEFPSAEDGGENDYEVLGDALITIGKRLTEDDESRARREEEEAVDEVRLKLPQGVSMLAWATMESWYTVARQRLKGGVASVQLGLPPATQWKGHPADVIAQNDEIAELDPYPDWLTANITQTSKEMLLRWAREARSRLRDRRGKH
ncbi:hypothetical protein Pmar_PMAR013628 [Perkinsus marinus ATCC 50983]|uniref:Uncharacterized protein n=1 Tax=Perkinsus marinus (strain ATCC 50983 / TXsc) TaxID=423536 RepID=C5KP61_PERM5|nr:hypothetical protein Pmar_PMAR013628 [Perkinsus marinus ATCC 50983]EER13736.1 hypothetical protein Pmar_PMAR013628 [Perkinsus marinus ATCC 50983]|eukprot:XP_002781941.1 hypothetical protein Pmar_PMAR013628 [Perkinsus marinus ATCC 50983]